MLANAEKQKARAPMKSVQVFFDLVSAFKDHKIIQSRALKKASLSEEAISSLAAFSLSLPLTLLLCSIISPGSLLVPLAC